jgi:hypothetical protein
LSNVRVLSCARADVLSRNRAARQSLRFGIRFYFQFMGYDSAAHFSEGAPSQVLAAD